MPIAIVRARMLVIPIHTNLDNQLFNGSVINTDVPNADVSRDNNVHNINAVDVTFPPPPPPHGRSTSVQSKIRSRKSQYQDAFPSTVDASSPLTSALLRMTLRLSPPT